MKLTVIHLIPAGQKRQTENGTTIMSETVISMARVRNGLCVPRQYCQDIRPPRLTWISMDVYWIFSDITEDSFRWENVTIRKDGTRIPECEIYGKRIR